MMKNNEAERRGYRKPTQMESQNGLPDKISASAWEAPRDPFLPAFSSGAGTDEHEGA